MNYYEKHIGDYIRDTVGLSLMEDGAYNRLLDQHYQTERALPLDKKEIYRMARANSAAERKAVDYVLAKFFTLDGEGYTQKRAQAQIEEYWDREPAAEVKKENAKIRQQRARARRKALFDQLRVLGVTPVFNASMKVLEAELSRVTKRDESQQGHAGGTRDDTLTHTPSTKLQTPISKTEPPPPVSTEVGAPEPAAPAPTRVGQISILLRGYGVMVTPHLLAQPQHAWISDARATDEILHLAVAEAKESNPTGRLNANYLAPIIHRLLNPPPPRKPKNEGGSWRFTPAGIESKGRELGIFARAGETHDSFAVRIQAAIEKRSTTP